MSAENNSNKVNERRKVCNYRLYTQDGKFTEVGSGKLTLLIDYSSTNRKRPITGLGMTMDGSSGIDEVLIDSHFMLINDGFNISMHVNLKGNQGKKNSISGYLRNPIPDTRYIITGEYRYVGGPFQDVLPNPPSGFDDYYILLREDDTEGLEDAEPISTYFE